MKSICTAYQYRIYYKKGDDSMLTDRMKDELIQGLRDIFANNIEAIILYGSVARNESTPESDIDIAVIVKKGMDIETKDRFICWAADMDLRYDRIFSIVDIEKENLQKWGKILPFYQNVQKEGIVLWKAA